MEQETDATPQRSLQKKKQGVKRKLDMTEVMILAVIPVINLITTH